MNYIITTTNGELYHHGIKGQKWGVRRFQNEDGSLTALGKQRYLTDSEVDSEFLNSKKHIVDRYSYKTSNSETVKEAGGFLQKQSQALTDEFNSMCNQTAEHLNNLGHNKTFKNEVMKQLDKDLWSDADEEDIRYEIENAVMDVGSKYYSDKLKKTASNFENGVETYYNNLRDITNDIVGKYGNEPVASVLKQTGRGFFGPTYKKENVNYSTVIENTLHDIGDSRWVKYLYNHQEMAYLEEPGSSAMTKLIDQIYDEYKKTK